MRRGILAIAGRQMLDGLVGREVLRGCIAAISNGMAWQQNEVLGLARDVLILQPSIPAAYEARTTLHSLLVAVGLAETSLYRDGLSAAAQRVP